MNAMRKTQMTIGIILVMSGTLAIVINTAFVLISIVIGLGLIKSGQTGVCPMEKFFKKRDSVASVSSDEEAQKK